MGSWKSFRHKVLTARQLSLRDWLVLGETWWILFFFHLALHWVPLDRLEAFTRLTNSPKTVPPDVLAWARHRQELISLAARYHLPPKTCLPRAFTLRWMLSRSGIPAQLRIGMNTKSSMGIQAHAWVEVEGEAIGEPEDITERFRILQGTM